MNNYYFDENGIMKECPAAVFKKILHRLKISTKACDIDVIRGDIATLIPKVKIMFEFNQNNHAHQYDLWIHCLQTVVNLPRNMDDDMLYLAALLHDIGKPECQVPGSREGDTNMHYYGHPKKSREIVETEILPELIKKGICFSDEDAQRLLYYVEYHDDHVSLRMKHVRRHTNMVSIDVFKKLMLLQVADAKAHVQLPIIKQRVEICTQLSGEYSDEIYKQILEGK